MSTQKKKISFTIPDPAINKTIFGVREGRYSSEPMVAVQNTETTRVVLENDRDRHLPCVCHILTGTEKLFPTAIDVCDPFMEIDSCVVLDDRLYDLFRAWKEHIQAEGEPLPFPRELADRLDALQIEHLIPPSSL